MTTEIPKPSEGFYFSENEKLYDWISDKRFKALLADESTNVHHIDVSTNNYGEFLFVTMSRPKGSERQFLTFWGLGYHESRERWLTEEWRWYETHQFSHRIPQKIDSTDAQVMVEERYAEIAPFATNPPQQLGRAKLYEMMADLTDEDGAFTELEDLGWPDWDDEDRS